MCSLGLTDQAREGVQCVVLVVDDDPLVLGIISRILEECGCDVRTARNGAEGLEVWEAHREEVELILSDVQMPVMDGEELVRQLHLLQSAVPVLLMSGERRPNGPTEKCTFLPKPFSVSALTAAMRRALDRPHA